MSNQGFNLRVAFACLEDVKTSFLNEFNDDERTSGIHLSLDKQFKKILKQKFETYNNPDVDKLTKISSNLKQTENIMKENLDKLVERGESLD